MRAKDAKQLDFPLLLQKLGHSPTKETRVGGKRELWYRSPLNIHEKTPSFHITEGNQVAWVFSCLSTDENGTIIDFVNALEGYPKDNIKMALAYLRGHFMRSLLDYQPKKAKSKPEKHPSFSFDKQINEEQKTADNALAGDRQLEFLQDLPLKSGVLLRYLEQNRKIPVNLAQRYLRLVRYKNLKLGKTFFAIGMKNRAGGFEIRAGTDAYSFKSALIAREISVIKGQDKTSVFVVEGMTDALSFLVLEGTNIPPCDVIVLHSINTYARCNAFIKEQGYQTIHLALDNDKSGRKCTARFSKDFGEKVLSHSEKFAPNKDLNMALQKGMTIRFFDTPELNQNLTYDLS